MPLDDLLTFDNEGLIPAVIVNASDNLPLVLCYMDRAALAKTLDTGLVHVFRRSQQRLMLKGETSGHTQRVAEVRIDCEGKSLMIKVQQKVAACHVGYFSCYYRRYNPHTGDLDVADDRVFDPKEVY